MANIPSNFSKAQLEETSFRASVSSDLLSRVGATINQGIDNALPMPLGSVEMSMLTEAQFQNVRNSGWVLCDGRNIVGSALNLLTGQTVAVDIRGRFPRGKDNGRGFDPNGELAIGTQVADATKAHDHSPYEFTSINAGSSGSNFFTVNSDSDRVGIFPTDASAAISVTMSATGSAENRPNNVTVNYFIRIN